MAQLITCIGEGKGTWGHVARVINEQEWDDVFIVTTEYFKDKFKVDKKFEMIVVDKDRSVPEMAQSMHKDLSHRLKGDVAVNFISGSGKEHMAMLSMLLGAGVGVRLMALTKDGVKQI
jgi:hypothetical protein